MDALLAGNGKKLRGKGLGGKIFVPLLLDFLTDGRYGPPLSDILHPALGICSEQLRTPAPPHQNPTPAAAAVHCMGRETHWMY